MKTVLIEGRTLPEVYHNALHKLFEEPEREMSVILKIHEPLAEPMISKCMPCGPHELEQYRQEAGRYPNLIIGGRLGEYRYYDMDQSVAKALEIAEGGTK